LASVLGPLGIKLLHCPCPVSPQHRGQLFQNLPGSAQLDVSQRIGRHERREILRREIIPTSSLPRPRRLAGL